MDYHDNMSNSLIILAILLSVDDLGQSTKEYDCQHIYFWVPIQGWRGIPLPIPILVWTWIFRRLESLKWPEILFTTVTLWQRKYLEERQITLELNYKFNQATHFILSGDSGNAVPHWQKFCTRVTHIWGNHGGQPLRWKGLPLEEPPSWSRLTR